MSCENKFCCTCKKYLPISNFGKNSNAIDSFQYSCKECRKEYAKRYRQTEKSLSSRKAYRQLYDSQPEVIARKNNPEHKRYRAKQQLLTHRKSILKKFGLTLEDKEKMFLSQNKSCYLCEKELSLFNETKNGNGACIDHDHKTGKVRGLLCRTCNTRLGIVEIWKDNGMLEKVFDYLKN